MIDFNKKYKNTDKFRKSAIQFQNTGSYCVYPSNTQEYFDFWDEETRRSLEGYTTEDGDWISGYYYFYLNYCPIQRIVNKVTKDDNGQVHVKRVRQLDFPDFWDYDAFFFESIQRAEDVGKHMCVLKSRRKGFEQPYSELVATPDGFTKMEYIKPGDLVATAKGTYTKVLEIYEQGYKDVYNVHLDDGRTVTCGANHLWYVINASNKLKPEVITTHDMLVKGLFKTYGGYNHYRYYVPAIEPVPYEEKELLVHPYILGALLGDGTINKRGKSIKISTADQEIIDKFKHILGEDYELVRDKSCYNYRIVYKKRFDKDITSKFENGKFGVNPLSRYITQLDLNVDCTEKYIPDEYKYSSIEQRFELVRGLMDTNGTISSDGSCMFVNTSKHLVNDLAQVLRSLGIRCEISTYKKDGCKLLYKLYIRTNLPIFSLTRKLERLSNKKINSKVAIIDIEFLKYQEKSKCIFVEDEDHVYLTKDYIPTHNSYKGGSMCCRNYYLIPNSKSYVYASDKQYLTEDGIMTKATDYMDFIDKNTAWGKKRSINTTLHKRAGFYSRDEFGNQVEMGYKSEIIGVTLKNNPGKARGKAAKLILFEEAGSFPELGAAWETARPSVEVDGVAFGLMMAFGTGGDEDSNFATLKNMFYNPKSFNCLEFDNIWDDVATDKCGFFCPQYTNMDLRDEEGNRLYMDKDGNTIRDKSIKYLLDERKVIFEKAKTQESIDRYVAERCLDKDTWISTEDGVMRIKDNPKAWISGVKDIYKVTTEDGAELYCTDNHKMFNGTDYKELKDYQIGDCIKYYNTEFGNEYQTVKVPGLIPATDYELKIDEDWAKFLGLFMGDGFYYGPSGKIGVVFDARDESSIEWCKSFMNKNFGNTRSDIIGSQKGGITLSVCRKNSIEIFKALDLVCNNSNGNLKRKVHIPEYIMKSPKSVVSSFLSGLFDSDGYSSKDGKHVGFFNKNKQLLLDMQFLLRGFDIHCSVKTRTAINGNGLKYDENKLNIRICDIKKFREHIGFISDRKNENIKNTEAIRKLRDYHYGKIVSVEYVRTDEVWDINTETHYLSANGIWVHNCLTPQEACLEFRGNIFPKKELQSQLARIRTDKYLKNAKQVGDLVFDKNNQLQWIQKKVGDITKYPLGKDDDPTGSIVIWEHPNTEAQSGLYIAGIDSYDYDQSTTTSLGSCIIYKRFQTFEEHSDIIVAEYTGRPATANDFYENVRKLLLYYNATAMYENQNKGLFVYLTNKHFDYLLADQPDILNDVVGVTKVQRKKGCHMNQQIKSWAFGLIKDWLNELDERGVKNLNKILSEPLLEELISCTDDSNVDRVMALCQVMIYRQQLLTIITKEEKQEAKKKALFEGPIFTNEWFNDDQTEQDDAFVNSIDFF